MHQAIEMGDKDTIANWLIKERKNVNRKRSGSSSHRHHAVANGTALHWAVYYGQVEIARVLLESGAGISKLVAKVQTFITIPIFNLVTHRDECYCLAAILTCYCNRKCTCGSPGWKLNIIPSCISTVELPLKVGLIHTG